ncbi:MAG: alpha/beta hydrolase [Clostridia bacterium]|nr:alpha/beta hydrolase [Clostridia bacterium]
MKQFYLHGLGQTPSSWDETLSYLKPEGEVFCPNFADLIHKNGAAYESLYSGFSSICQRETAPFDLCGLSLGGVLALHYAAEHIENVHSLVLIAAPYTMPKRLLQFQNFLFRLMPNAAFAQMGLAKNEVIQLCKTMAELDFRPVLYKISCPVLVICGEKDKANRKAAESLASAVKHAELVILNNAGHEVTTEVPKPLAEVLRAFYQKVHPMSQL